MSEILRIPHLAEKLAAAKILSSSAAAVSESLSSFSTWALAGSGALLAVTISNLQQVVTQVGDANVRWSMFYFVLAAGPAVVARYIGAAIKASALARPQIEKAGAELERVENADLEVFFAQYRRGFAFHLRWLVNANIKRVMEGDVAWGARIEAYASQIQALLVLLQLVLALLATWVLASGM